MPGRLLTAGLLPVPLATVGLEVRRGVAGQWDAHPIDTPSVAPISAATIQEAVEEMGFILAVALAAGDSGALLADGWPLLDIEPEGVLRYAVTIFQGERTGPVGGVWDEAGEARHLLSRQALPLWWAGRRGLDLESALRLAESCATEPKLLRRMNSAHRIVKGAAPPTGRRAGDGAEKLKIATLLFREMHDCTLPDKPRRPGVSRAAAARRVQQSALGRRYGDPKSIARLARDERLMVEARANADVWPKGAETAS